MAEGCFVALERCVVEASQYGRTCVAFHGAARLVVASRSAKLRGPQPVAR